MQRNAVILAAGKGTRMKSNKYKVLHKVAGKSMVEHVLTNVKNAGVNQIVTIVGHGAEDVKETLGNQSLYSYQEEQLGTAHAVKMANEHLKEVEGTTLVVCGDTPLITAHTLQKLIEHHESTHAQATVLSATAQIPFGYGRIVRDEQRRLQRIVEEKDATPEQKQIQEINSGIYLVDNAILQQLLPKLSNDNAQGEYYLTDIVQMAIADGVEVATVAPKFGFEVEGVNDRVQLARLERRYQSHQVEQLQRQGVQFADPSRVDIRGQLSVGRDVFVDVNVVFEGDVQLGDNV